MQSPRSTGLYALITICSISNISTTVRSFLCRDETTAAHIVINIQREITVWSNVVVTVDGTPTAMVWTRLSWPVKALWLIPAYILEMCSVVCHVLRVHARRRYSTCVDSPDAVSACNRCVDSSSGDVYIPVHCDTLYNSLIKRCLCMSWCGAQGHVTLSGKVHCT